jgi:nucleotide-binding universal stress UspA family protein
MAGWKKICCAVDFSPVSDAALREAARLAGSEGAALTLAHVFAAPRPGPVAASDMLAPGATPPADVEGRLRREIEPQMSARQAEAERIAGRAVEAILLVGKAQDVLAALAGDGGYDLMVVGTHGRTGVRRLVLGSVAEHVVRASPTSVLVVRG